jgi:hypothetical protein
MKRLIVCKNCETEQRKLFPVESPYPGENIKFVVGNALSDFKCDNCYSVIGIGDYACAISIWSKPKNIQYFPWENMCIVIKNK